MAFAQKKPLRRGAEGVELECVAVVQHRAEQRGVDAFELFLALAGAVQTGGIGGQQQHGAVDALAQHDRVGVVGHIGRSEKDVVEAAAQFGEQFGGLFAGKQLGRVGAGGAARQHSQVVDLAGDEGVLNLADAAQQVGQTDMVSDVQRFRQCAVAQIGVDEQNFALGTGHREREVLGEDSGVSILLRAGEQNRAAVLLAGVERQIRAQGTVCLRSGGVVVLRHMEGGFLFRIKHAGQPPLQKRWG